MARGIMLMALTVLTFVSASSSTYAMKRKCVNSELVDCVYVPVQSATQEPAQEPAQEPTQESAQESAPVQAPIPVPALVLDGERDSMNLDDEWIRVRYRLVRPLVSVNEDSEFDNESDMEYTIKQFYDVNP